MELAKVEALLERYFDAETSLTEEQQLRLYFSEGNIPPHLQAYKALFDELDMPKAETKIGARAKKSRTPCLGAGASP